MATGSEEFPSVIGLNVGGTLFATRLSTLIKYPDSMLGAMFSGRHNLDTDRDGNYFIDRNGTYFGHILDFLRNDQYLPPRHLTEAVLKEAEYYGIVALVEILQKTPVLFLEYSFREKHRRAVVNYDRFKEEVIEIAMKRMMNNFDIKYTTEVLIHYYTSTEGTINEHMPTKTVFSFEEVASLLVGQERAEYSIFLNEEDAKNFKEFIDVLKYDLNKAGYHIRSQICEIKCNPFCCQDVLPEFSGKVFRRLQCCTINVTWPLAST